MCAQMYFPKLHFYNVKFFSQIFVVPPYEVRSFTVFFLFQFVFCNLIPARFAFIGSFTMVYYILKITPVVTWRSTHASLPNNYGISCFLTMTCVELLMYFIYISEILL
jgi:hypothetical protein